MNRKIAKTGSILVLITVVLFAVCMLIPFDMGSYFVCILLPVGFVMMAAGFCSESSGERKTAALVGMTFAAVYMVLISLVYYAQLTVVRFNLLNAQAALILDFQKGGLLFNYDLLGYGIMALSTFFLGLTIDAKTKADKWLKFLLLIHGVFYPACLIMPITGVFASMANGSGALGGTIALECWCIYFTPIAILSVKHFGKEKTEAANNS